MILPFQGTRPKMGTGVWIAPTATVIGDVELGEDVSVWFGSVIRGDVFPIRVGRGTNIQDNCVLHVTEQNPTVLADDVTVGNSVTLHGCSIDRLCLVGIGAIVLNGAVVGQESIIAAGALVPEGMQVPPRSLVMGMPAKVRREITDEEREGLRRYAENYVRYKDEYRAAESLGLPRCAAISDHGRPS